MTKKEKYEQRKKMGLCPCCGKNPHTEDKTLCQMCLDKANENRKYKRSRHICVKCGSNKSAPNRVYCDECLEQRRNKYQEKKKEKEYIESVKLYRERHAEKCRENGLCVRCKKPVFENHVLCYEHLIERKNYMRRIRALAREYKGE